MATIPTGHGDPQVTIALANGGRRAYVGAPDSPYLSVVDTQHRKVADNNVLVGNGTVAIATARTAAGPRAYLAQLQYSRLGVLDTRTRQITDYLALPHGPQSVTTAARWPDGLGRELEQRRDLGRPYVRQQDPAHGSGGARRAGQLGRLRPTRHPRLGQRPGRRLGRQRPVAARS